MADPIYTNDLRMLAKHQDHPIFEEVIARAADELDALRARDERLKALLAPLFAAHEAMEKRPGPSELDDFVLAARRICKLARGSRDTEPAPPMHEEADHG